MKKLPKTQTQTSVLRYYLNPIIKNVDCCYISEEKVQLNKNVYIRITANMTIAILQTAIPQLALEMSEF
jgi:hypothetical protein